ncbi:AMP-binding protein [Bacteroidales bacterium OttesenSCG-928-A14]|nr:AMP-binding protein [Bacteroidales bacterium OttesenSCG-928-A14]
MYKNREKTAINFKEINYSYESLSRHVYCYSRCFSHIQSSAKIIIFAENSPEWIFALYGSWMNDGIAIPVDSNSTENELSYIVADVQPQAIFTTEEQKSMVANVLKQLNFNIPILSANDVDISDVETVPSKEFKPKDEHATALINYTSGTTGSAKGVMLTFHNLIYICHSVSTDIEIFRHDRNVMILLPTHHILPLMGSIVAPLMSGATVYIAESLAPDVIINTLTKGKISIIIGVPRLYEMLAKGIVSKINAQFLTKFIFKFAGLINSPKFSRKIFNSVHEKFGGHVRYMVCGGAALPTEIGKAFKTLGFEILEGYGMTEMAPLISFTHPGKWSIGYAGYPLKGMDMKIEDGEVCVKGPNMMTGYYNKPAETAEAIVDGWLHTGDIGFLDGKGLKLTGRKKELIVASNGKKIDPVEIENEFYKIAAFAKEVGVFMHEDVIQAVIYPDMNNVRANGIQDIREHAKTVVLALNEKIAPYKRIKNFHIISEELPKTKLGKVQRFKFADLIAKKEVTTQEDGKEYSQQYILLRNFVENETGCKAWENAHFEIDLAMDSLSRVALLAYIETTFGVSLNEGHLNELNTLAKLNQHIEENNTGINLTKKNEWKDILSAKISNLTLPEAGLTNKTLNFIIRYLLRIVYRYKTRGMTNIPDKPCILVANHQSMLDGVLITSTLERKINKNTYLFAKEKYWKTGIMSFMARKNNVILMDINQNLKEAIQKLSYVLQNGKNVIIFPEGTRSKTGIRDFKDTFAILSKELNVPIVPIAINGANRAVYQKVKLPRFLSPLSVDFLETIYPKAEESYQDLKNRVKEIIASKLKKK